MNTPPDREPSDWLLARAVEALRRAPVPEGPSAEVVARTLAALQVASGPCPPAPRRRVRQWAMRSAAAAVIAAATLLLCGRLARAAGPGLRRGRPEATRRPCSRLPVNDAH